jgi:hypothetical protein
MSHPLLNRLLEIYERDNGVVKELPAEVIVDVVVGEPLYEIGTVFVRRASSINSLDHAAILAHTGYKECELICLPAANRWTTDPPKLPIADGHDGPSVRHFHRVFGESWIVSQRGKDALGEWARTEV